MSKVEVSVSRTGVPPRGPVGGTPTFRETGQVGVDSVDPGGPQGRAPKVPEKAGRVGLDFIRTRPEVRPWGARGGTRTFRGLGQVGVDSIDLGVPWGRAPKILKRTWQGGLGCEQAYWIPY